MRFVEEFQLPLRCEWCNKTATSIFIYHAIDFFEDAAGGRPVCEEHRKTICGMDEKEILKALKNREMIV